MTTMMKRLGLEGVVRALRGRWGDQRRRRTSAEYDEDLIQERFLHAYRDVVEPRGGDDDITVIVTDIAEDGAVMIDETSGEYIAYWPPIAPEDLRPSSLDYDEIERVFWQAYIETVLPQFAGTDVVVTTYCDHVAVDFGEEARRVAENVAYNVQ